MARARWLLILGLLTLASCTASPTAMPTPVPQPTVERTVITMGTVLQVHASGAGAHRGAEAAIREVLAADRRWSSWREDSQLSRLHGTPVGIPEVVDAAFRRGLLLAFAWSKRTDGAFDPTIGRLVELRRAGPPTAADLVRARSAAGLSQFRIADGAVIRTGEARLAEGGFAKGLALDAAIATALDLDPDVRIELDLGGQLAWRHPGPRQPIAIADPDRRRAGVAWIDPPPSGSLATSGTSERGAHILDPRTGLPAPDWGAVTVLCTGADAACAADCLSTALFVLGPVAGHDLALGLPHVEALFLERTPDGLRQHATPGMRARLRSRPDSHTDNSHTTTPDSRCTASR